MNIHDMWDDKKAQEYMSRKKYLYVQRLFKNLFGSSGTSFRLACAAPHPLHSEV